MGVRYSPPVEIACYCCKKCYHLPVEECDPEWGGWGKVTVEGYGKSCAVHMFCPPCFECYKKRFMVFCEPCGKGLAA